MMKTSIMKKFVITSLFISLFLTISTLFEIKRTKVHSIHKSDDGISSSATQKSCCGAGCRAHTKVSQYYDEKYFNWQKNRGSRSATSKRWDLFFNTKQNMTVADLGAGGGFTLASLNVKRKIGIELNNQARRFINENSPEIDVYKYPEDVPSGTVDLLISRHALEHMECPITELQQMRKALKPNAKAVIGVPNEGTAFAMAATEQDIHQHMYTWNRQNLYNTVVAAGFIVDSIEPPIEDHLKKLAVMQNHKMYKDHHSTLELWVRATNPSI